MKRTLSLIADAILFIAIPFASNAQVVSVKSKPMESTKVADRSGYDMIGDALYEVIYEYHVLTKAKGAMSVSNEGSSIIVRNSQAESPEGQDDTFSDTYTTILQFGSGQARFLDYLAYRVDSLAFAGAPEDLLSKASREVARSSFYFEPVVFQNWPEGSMTVDDILVPSLFTYTEDMSLEWILGEGRKEVCGYPCQEARTSYAGRDWTVWYAPTVPVNAGPWKLSGLPGLIMEARDADGLHCFTATSLRKTACPIVRVQEAGRDKTQRNRFIQRRNSSGGNSLDNVPIESVRSVSVIKNANGGVIILNGNMPVRTTNHTFVPLELR